MYINIYISYTPRTQPTSVFEDQPSKIRPFSIKTRVIWVLGIHIEFDTYTLAFSIQFWSFCLLDLAGVAEVSFEFPDTETWRKKGFWGH